MKLITEEIPRLRQRKRKNGTWRIWWEPKSRDRDLGFSSVDLDPDRPTWSVREAQKLNDEVDLRRAGPKILVQEAKDRAATEGRAIERPARARTITALILRYETSSKFLTKAPATKTDYLEKMSVIKKKWGNTPVPNFTKAVMHEWYETLRENAGVTRARGLIRMMSVLLSYAELLDWRPPNSNPCFRLGMTQPKGRSRTATWAELDALTAAADKLGHPEVALAILLSALQGQRQTTVIEARKDEFQKIVTAGDGGEDLNVTWAWSFVRSKRQNVGVTPIHPETQPRLEAALRASPVEFDRLLIDGKTGRPPTAHFFRKRWELVRAVAATELPSCANLQFRDLRRTFANLARDGGATIDDTADVLGNSAATNAELREVYMAPQFTTAMRAVHAIKRPDG